MLFTRRTLHKHFRGNTISVIVCGTLHFLTIARDFPPGFGLLTGKPQRCNSMEEMLGLTHPGETVFVNPLGNMGNLSSYCYSQA